MINSKTLNIWKLLYISLDQGHVVKMELQIGLSWNSIFHCKPMSTNYQPYILRKQGSQPDHDVDLIFQQGKQIESHTRIQYLGTDQHLGRLYGTLFLTSLTDWDTS